jgi:CubicO group peptidase (beta-lactamase class C family)
MMKKQAIHRTLFILTLVWSSAVLRGLPPEWPLWNKEQDKPDTVQVDEEGLHAYLKKKMESAGLIGMQVAFVSGTGFIWQGSYGLKDHRTTEKVDNQTLFMIASCSKPVTALGILKLKDQGKLSLDDPVNSYLPFPVTSPYAPQEEVTFRMLLSHVSFIRDNWEILMPLYTLEQGGDSPLPLGEFLRDYLVEGGLYYDSEKNFSSNPAATQFSYCNVGYALLGYLIEQISGMSFKQFMAREIFEPLGMNESYWFLSDIPHNNIARPHEMPSKKSGETAPRVLPHFGYPDFPDGQLRTTAADYGRFLLLLLNRGHMDGQSFIHRETIDEFLEIQYPEVNKYQAIAWNYNEFESVLYYMLMPRLPSHTGADPGVATAVSFDSESQTGAVIFTNSPPVRFRDQKVFYQEIMKRLLKEAKQLADVPSGSPPGSSGKIR